MLADPKILVVLFSFISAFIIFRYMALGSFCLRRWTRIDFRWRIRLRFPFHDSRRVWTHLNGHKCSAKSSDPKSKSLAHDNVCSGQFESCSRGNVVAARRKFFVQFRRKITFPTTNWLDCWGRTSFFNKSEIRHQLHVEGRGGRELRCLGKKWV
jgi:hypothetical protein